MRYFALRRAFFSFILLFCMGALDSLAQGPPIHLQNYEFVPSHSTLYVTGGFAGFDILADVEGSYNFATGYVLDFPNLTPFASFDNVDAVAINPTDFGPYSFDLDESINLSGLEGHPIPFPFPQIAVFPPPIQLYRFTGVDGQGADFRLLAATVNDEWMFLGGRNFPDSSGADFFNYRFRALARNTPFADFDDNGTVGENDFSMLLAEFGSNAIADGVNALDLTGDGDIDGADFLMLQTQYGESIPDIDFNAIFNAANANAATNASGVPEPSSLILLGLLASTLVAFRPKSVSFH